MPPGLVPGVRTQGLRWPCQEVHHCATHVMVAYQELFCCIYTALIKQLLRNVWFSTIPVEVIEGLSIAMVYVSDSLEPLSETCPPPQTKY